MHDCELYRRILGLESPWRVERVDLDLQETKEVCVVVSRDPAAPCTCPVRAHHSPQGHRPRLGAVAGGPVSRTCDVAVAPPS